ncbi:MAG: transcription antitermination factor NusB [Deltaproteobacteria bacterium]|nr:transcription antitermination factor NusB [Deltaproteobacteria bacterium]
MGYRHKGRELALQILYQIDMKGSDPKSELRYLGHEEPLSQEVEDFARTVVEGTYRNLREIDQMIEKFSTHWKLNRMSAVDRNILRLGAYELLYDHEVPTPVVLDEAIEIAKKFGSENSSSFINGILDHAAKEVRK